ncbi:hypothetical protein ICW40_05215 [Actinotalea ferrariae]|uniref:hypothetical protein n=1 Tax=Actinotalea ferrariae TaxID=1386098 RepID=UPI001C8B91EA|nr:hypothetical protein [Actinotalea ferrariae]MBX9244205.1 hypothetical protein [Actinotalea ferrariae]
MRVPGTGPLVTLWTSPRTRRPSRAAAGALGVLAAATAALALTGGLRPVDVDVRTQAGETVDLGAVRITPTGHLVTDDVRAEQLEEAEAAAWLAVEVLVEGTSDETLLSVPKVLDVPAGIMPELDEYDASLFPVPVLLRDGSDRPQVHPGLPEEMLLLWPVEDVDDVPDELELTLLGSEQYFSRSQNVLLWAAPEPVGTVVLPRLDRLPPGLAGATP